MKLTEEDMKSAVAFLRGKGIDIGLRDICYVLLCRDVDEPVFAYRAIFGNAKDAAKYQEYSISEKVDELKLYIDREFPFEKDGEDTKIEERPKDSDADNEAENTNLSFDEIKKGLEEDLAALVELRDQADEMGNPVLEPKDLAAVVGRIADIRTKLVDKFGSTQKQIEQRVVVAQKYSDICPYCNREIAIDPTHKRIKT